MEQQDPSPRGGFLSERLVHPSLWSSAENRFWIFFEHLGVTQEPGVGERSLAVGASELAAPRGAGAPEVLRHGELRDGVRANVHEDAMSLVDQRDELARRGLRLSKPAGPSAVPEMRPARALPASEARSRSPRALPPARRSKITAD